MKAVLAIVALGFCVAGAAAQEASVADGEAFFRRCTPCHAIGEGAANKIGPVLNGVLGRTVGTAPGYVYSAALGKLGQKGMVWTEETLDQWLTKPRVFAAGTKMNFAGILGSEDRADVIAYLATFSPGYVPQEK